MFHCPEIAMKRIVVYDSDADIFNLIKTALMHIRIEVIYAGCFRQILDHFKHKTCLAIVFNLDKLPEGDMDNIELLHIIKRLAPDLPVIGTKHEAVKDDFYPSILSNVIIVNKSRDFAEFRKNMIAPLLGSISREIEDSSIRTRASQ